MCSINNQVINKSVVAQLLIAGAFYSIGSYCMQRINIPWKQVIENSAVKAGNLNRLRITTCCIGISGVLQATSRISKLSTSPQTNNVWILNAGSMALFGYLIVTEKIHRLITSFIFGTQIIISNVYIKETPLLENRNELPDQQLVSYEENQNELPDQQLVSYEENQNELPDQQLVSYEENQNELPDQQLVSYEENQNELIQNHQVNHVGQQEGSIDSKLDEIQENLKIISNLQEQDENLINEYIDACKNCLKRLHETDRENYKGFNPKNESAKRLRCLWLNLISLLPKPSQKEAFRCSIEELSRCNYFIPGKLSFHIICSDPSVEKWVEKNHHFFEAKARISVMETDEEQKSEEKLLTKLVNEGKQTSKSYSILRKQELINTYFLRKCQLKVPNLKEVTEKHKTWYSKIYPTETFYKEYRNFLSSFDFLE